MPGIRTSATTQPGRLAGTLSRKAAAESKTSTVKPNSTTDNRPVADGDRPRHREQRQEVQFFKKIQGDLVTGLYNNKELWPLFGYEGSSWQKGGYLTRGFNDLDWL